MKTLTMAAATILAAAGCAVEALADEAMVTKTGSAAPATVSSQPAACGSIEDFFLTSCALTSSGITVYGIVDTGMSWRSHGAPFSGTSAPGVDYLVQRYSNRARWDLGPNGLSQSNIGIKGKEPIAPGWDFIFDLQAGFDPYSLRFPNGPHSAAQNAGIPLTSQDSYADSSRAGQFYNSVGYAGVSSPFGTLTLFRQNALTLDAVFAYDPMGASYAFSPLGWQGLTCGAGNTETCRHSTALKYRVDIDQFRVAALWQFGGYELNNAATGTYQLQVGGDINLAGGKLSLDAIGSYAQNAVAIGLAGNTLPAVLPQVLTATLSDNSAVMLVGKYTRGPWQLFGGYEFIRYAPPSDPFAPGTGFIDIGGDFVCAGCAAVNNTNINNTAFSAGDKLFHVVWTGVKYAVTDDLHVMGAYYYNDQPAFGAPVNCPNPAAFANCHGTLNAASVAVDWQFAKKFDAYAGVMWSQVSGGLANGFLNRASVAPTVGLRFRF
ncbi:porin [Bradyrhizobium sp. CB1650]|uniref:porin n=1 Tax=Bradyrhizobium sp. CB1650 TaxID=3039153 RepID=UPI0024349516|nr:porin [Bradyrhizobium sp. CB1650]WGD50257.1 porin [Bradyrhizobium sp. CB1650]